jgi:glycogen phosphorylase
MTIHHRQPVTPALAKSVLERLTLTLGVAPQEATPADWFRATALAVRDRLVGRWHETNRIVQEKGLKQVAYLSMEFLLARELENALMSTGLVDECRAALARHGVNLDELMAIEPSPALGNGGLGRLAACFLDSTASIGLPCIGYGIRYEYGMFRQEIADGWQVEHPDRGSTSPIRGTSCGRSGPIASASAAASSIAAFAPIGSGPRMLSRWRTTTWSPGMAIRRSIRCGCGASSRSTPSTWGRSTVVRSSMPRPASCTARPCRGCSIPTTARPRGANSGWQEHLFVSASVQDLLASFCARHSDWTLLPDKLTIHLNDTHPALAPAELMRLLVDEHALEWDEAWALVSAVFTYTNHTLMPEALEVWPLALMRRVCRATPRSSRRSICAISPGCAASRATIRAASPGSKSSRAASG